jgi:hypothetical protein
MVFPKNTFQSVFTKSPPHLFLGPNRLCGTFRGKIFTDKNFPQFCLKRPRNCFSEKHVSCPFLQNRPSPISRPDGLCGAFRGKIVTDKNFAHFCLKRPLNHFSENHVSCPFLRNRPPHLFSGQTDE